MLDNVSFEYFEFLFFLLGCQGAQNKISNNYPLHLPLLLHILYTFIFIFTVLFYESFIVSHIRYSLGYEKEMLAS